MGATSAEIASARQLAQSRGYDPNLVDEGNADRANTAFPVQTKSTSSSSSSYITPAAAPISSGGLTAAQLAPTPGSGAPGDPLLSSGGGSTGGGTPDSMVGLAKVVDPGMDASVMNKLNIGGAASGGGGSMGMSDGDSLSGLVGATTPGLRSLGRRSPPMESTDVAQRGKRAY